MRVTITAAVLSVQAALGFIAMVGTAAHGEGTALPATPLAERSSVAGPGNNGCARVDPVELENTHWKLTRLGGRAVVVGQGQGEPHLVLRPERQEATGSGGATGCSAAIGSKAGVSASQG